MTVTYDIIVQGNNLSLRDGFLGLANVTLVHSPGGLLLFDTGHYVNRSLLLDGLARHGVDPAEVKTVCWKIINGPGTHWRRPEFR